MVVPHGATAAANGWIELSTVWTPNPHIRLLRGVAPRRPKRLRLDLRRPGAHIGVPDSNPRHAMGDLQSLPTDCGGNWRLM